MLSLKIIRLMLFGTAVLFGSFGALSLYLGLTARPGMNAYAVVFLSAAAVIMRSLQQSG